MKKLSDILAVACSEGRKWATGKSVGEIWYTCPRADWLMWFAKTVGVSDKNLRLAGCDCARTALPYAGKNRAVCVKAIEKAERAINAGRFLKDNCKEVEAAWRAYFGGGSSAGARAAYAAAHAAAGCLLSSAYGAGRAAAFATGGSGKANEEMCRLIRRRITGKMIEKLVR